VFDPLTGPKLLDEVARAGSSGSLAVSLARVVSLAAFVEPGLLRRARHMFVPAAGAATESALWFSPLVLMRNRLGFTLRPEVAEELRWQLAEMRDREQAARIRTVVESCHAGYPSLLRLEEEIVWESVRAGSIAPPEDRLNELVARAVRAMVDDEAAGLDVAHWAVQAWPRLPPAARATRAAHLLAIGATVRAGVPLELDVGSEIHGSLDWLLPESARNRAITLGALLLPDAVRFVDARASSLRMQLPATHPLLLDVSWEADVARHAGLVSVAADTEVPLPGLAGSVTLRTLAGRAYVVRPAGSAATPATFPRGTVKVVTRDRAGVLPQRADLATLVEAARRDETRAWRELIARLKPAVRAVGLRYGLTEDEIDDVAQASWLRLISNLDHVRDASAVAAWVTTVARRESMRVVRDRPRLLTTPVPERPVSEPAASESVFDRQREVLSAVLAKLPNRQRELLTFMIANPDATYEEISRTLDLPRGSIGPTRSRAISRLRRDLGDHWDLGP
jgi:RNA polymerase sigma factor (sigma-70 family)